MVSSAAAPQAPQAPPPPPPPSMSSATSARDLLLVSLSRFYSQRGHMQRVLPYVTCTSGVSLRLIDWFVTNYAKKHNIILTRTASNNVIHLNVYLSYRAQLKAYSKQQFDPFRRRDRVVFYYDRDRSVETTLGQLNFFRWMLQNDVLDYVIAHAADIERDMLGAQRGGGGAAVEEEEQGAEHAQQQLLPRHHGGAAPCSPSKATLPGKAAPAAKGAKGAGAAGGKKGGGAGGADRAEEADSAGRAAGGKRRGALSACAATRNMTRLVGPRTVLFD